MGEGPDRGGKRVGGGAGPHAPRSHAPTASNGLTWGFSVPKPRYVEENAQSRLGSLWSSSLVFNAPWPIGSR